MLHRLGVNMGAPYWENSDAASPQNYYEPLDLSMRLRTWWEEPNLVERVGARRRVRYLKRWITEGERGRSPTVGAKHPLLSLCGHDLLSAWGRNARLVWVYRPLDESIVGLQRRGWFRGREVQMQERLWDALCQLNRSVSGIIRIHWGDVKADPAGAVNQLTSLAGVEPSPTQIDSAVRFVRP